MPSMLGSTGSASKAAKRKIHVGWHGSFYFVAFFFLSPLFMKRSHKSTDPARRETNEKPKKKLAVIKNPNDLVALP